MISGSQHEMVICATYPTGAQEWYCPVCGRRYVLQWPPSYSKIVLEVGDEMAVHVGGTGSQSTTQDEPADKPEIPPDDLWQESSEFEGNLNDPYLSPFSDWLDGLDH